MPGIDESRTFTPLGLAILTVSDTRTLETDKSGATLEQLASTAGHVVVAREIVADDQPTITGRARDICAREDVHVLLATGGTGITGRDVTPEAFSALYDKEIPGFGELFRFLSYQNIGTSTIQSRASAGVHKGKLLFALPGSTGACKDAWEGILKHQLDSRFRPCNFAELLGRLNER